MLPVVNIGSSKLFFFVDVKQGKINDFVIFKKEDFVYDNSGNIIFFTKLMNLI